MALTGTWGKVLLRCTIASCDAASLITKSEQRCVRNEFGLGVSVAFLDGNPIIEKNAFLKVQLCVLQR